MFIFFYVLAEEWDSLIDFIMKNGCIVWVYFRINISTSDLNDHFVVFFSNNNFHQYSLFFFSNGMPFGGSLVLFTFRINYEFDSVEIDLIYGVLLNSLAKSDIFSSDPSFILSFKSRETKIKWIKLDHFLMLAIFVFFFLWCYMLCGAYWRTKITAYYYGCRCCFYWAFGWSAYLLK